MLNKLSCEITKILLKNQIGTSDDEIWYTYGLEILIGKTITYTIIIVFSLLCSGISGAFESLLFLFSFAMMRKRSGGYHANSYYLCSVLSIVLCILITQVLAPLLLTNKIVLVALLILSSCVIAFLAPVCHPASGLRLKDEKTLKKQTMFVLIIEVFIVVTLLFTDSYFQLQSILVCSLSLNALLLIIAKTLKQEGHENDEQEDSITCGVGSRQDCQ